jgi:hypothetical protein
MQRVTHSVAGQDAGSRPEATGARQAPVASAGPSYVEAVLFGRKRREPTASAADLTFLPVLRRVRRGNVKSKAAPES